MGSFVQPQLGVGDRVLYYSNPDNPQNPSMVSWHRGRGSRP